MFTFEDLICGSLYLVLIGGLGYGVVCLLLQGSRRGWIELLGLSFAAGAGALSFLLFYVSLGGYVPSRSILIAIAIITLCGLGLLFQRKKLSRPAMLKPPVSSLAFSPLGLLSFVAILFAVLNASWHAGWPILLDVDGFAIWMFKAKWVALQPLHPMPGVFLDPILSYSHQDYPLSLPFLTAGLYAALGRIDDSMLKILLVPIFLSLLAILFSAVARFHRRSTALAITAIFAASPTLTFNAGSVAAETSLILAFTASMAMLLRWMETSDAGDLRLAACFAAIAAFTKNEGLAMFPIVGAASLLWAWFHRHQMKIRQWSIAAVISVVVLSPWLIFRIFLPKTHEDYGGKLTHPTTIFYNLARANYVVPTYLMKMFDGPNVGIVWYLLLIVTPLGWRGFYRGPVRLLWALLLLQLGLYLSTFIVTPWDEHILLPMISGKLLTQASPLAALLIALHLRAMHWPGSAPEVIGSVIEPLSSDG